MVSGCVGSSEHPGVGWRLLKQDGRCSTGSGPSKDPIPLFLCCFWMVEENGRLLEEQEWGMSWLHAQQCEPGWLLQVPLQGSICHHGDPSLTTSFLELSVPCSERTVAFSSSDIHGLCLCVLVPQRSRVPSGRGLKRSPPPGSLACSSAWASRGSGQGTRSPSASKSLSSCR